MKPNFKGGHPFAKYFCRGDGKNRDYDEQASVPWAGNISTTRVAVTGADTALYNFVN